MPKCVECGETFEDVPEENLITVVMDHYEAEHGLNEPALVEN